MTQFISTGALAALEYGSLTSVKSIGGTRASNLGCIYHVHGLGHGHLSSLKTVRRLVVTSTTGYFIDIVILYRVPIIALILFRLPIIAVILRILYTYDPSKS